jgi:hypothetical protein
VARPAGALSAAAAAINCIDRYRSGFRHDQPFGANPPSPLFNPYEPSLFANREATPFDNHESRFCVSFGPCPASPRRPPALKPNLREHNKANLSSSCGPNSILGWSNSRSFPDVSRRNRGIQ